MNASRIRAISLRGMFSSRIEVRYHCEVILRERATAATQHRALSHELGVKAASALHHRHALVPDPRLNQLVRCVG